MEKLIDWDLSEVKVKFEYETWNEVNQTKRSRSLNYLKLWYFIALRPLQKRVIMQVQSMKMKRMRF